MIRPPFSADKKTLNAYIDHLEWKMEHKDQNIRSLTAQCEAYAKSMKRNHQITKNLIDNVSASLPMLSPGTSHVTLSEIGKDEAGNFNPKIIVHTNMSKDMGMTINEFKKKYGIPVPDSHHHNFVPLYPGAEIYNPQSLNILHTEIIEETQEPTDVPKYKVIIILIVYVIICIIIVLIVIASKSK